MRHSLAGLMACSWNFTGGAPATNCLLLNMRKLGKFAISLRHSKSSWYQTSWGTNLTRHFCVKRYQLDVSGLASRSITNSSLALFLNKILSWCIIYILWFSLKSLHTVVSPEVSSSSPSSRNTTFWHGRLQSKKARCRRVNRTKKFNIKRRNGKEPECNATNSKLSWSPW